MSTLTALVLVIGALSWLLLGHYLRVRRAAMAGVGLHPPDFPTEPSESEARMSMSQQQLRTLGLSRVRKVVASGEYSASDVKKWKSELGDDAVQRIVDAAADTKKPEPKKSTTTTTAKE